MASGDFKNPSWLDAHDPEKQAEYELTIRPYWNKLESSSQMKAQFFTGQEWSQFKDDVTPTEEMQMVDLIKLELLMNRSLEGNKQIYKRYTSGDHARIREIALRESQDADLIFNMGAKWPPTKRLRSPK